MRLLIADDHTLFRDALVQYIERAVDGASVSLAKDFPQAMEQMRSNPDQDLVLLDLRMPGMDGLNGFKHLKESYPDTRVALMSGVAEEEDVNKAFEFGAVGYFPKTLSGKALLQAIQHVLNGEKFMPMDEKNKTPLPSYYGGKPSNDPYKGMQEPQQGIEDDNVFNLTPRETEVLGYLVKGASNKEIASELGLQIVTVKLHVRGICRKLDVKNRTQAALLAKDHGYDKRAP